MLQSFVAFAPGEPYDASAIAQLQRELAGAEYFASVNVVPQLDAARNVQIPIRVEAAPARPTSFSVGGGFSTDDGPRFSTSYRNVRRNREGHQLDGDLLLAHVRQNASFEYRVPLGNPQRDWLSYRAGIAREDIDAGVGSAARAGVRRTHVGDAFTRTRFLDVLFERDDIGGEDLSTRLLLPGLSWARSYRDDFVRPREGHRVEPGAHARCRRHRAAAGRRSREVDTRHALGRARHHPRPRRQHPRQRKFRASAAVDAVLRGRRQ